MKNGEADLVDEDAAEDINKVADKVQSDLFLEENDEDLNLDDLDDEHTLQS